jgi:transposase
VEAVQQRYPEAKVEVWAFDEHRLGLKSILRKVWSLVAERVIAPVQHLYEWLYVYGYVHPETGSTEWHLMPRVNHQWLQASLFDFAQQQELGKEKVILLVVDNAGWHRTEKLQLPEGLELLFLPAYSPELQPAERLWSLVDEPIVNQAPQSLECLEEMIAQRCCVLSEQFQRQIRQLTNYSWWPQTGAILPGTT